MPTPQEVLAAVRHFAESGEYPGGIEQMKADMFALAGTPEGDQVMALLESLGANEGGSEPLDIATFYVPGTTPYELKWPLGVPLPIPFTSLDHKTQFFVLFGDWTRREMEASYGMLNGDPQGAKAAYEECLARARQLEVKELIARSHEGLARVAGVLNDRVAEREHLQTAMATRA